MTIKQQSYQLPGKVCPFCDGTGPFLLESFDDFTVANDEVPQFPPAHWGVDLYCECAACGFIKPLELFYTWVDLTLEERMAIQGCLPEDGKLRLADCFELRASWTKLGPAPVSGLVTPRFELGQVRVSPGACYRLMPARLVEALARHVRGDSGFSGWTREDFYEDFEQAVSRGLSITSSYESPPGTQFWFKTARDRKSTAVRLVAEEVFSRDFTPFAEFPPARDATPRFRPATVLKSPGAEGTFGPELLQQFIDRHARGDWGDVCINDWRSNERSLADGSRLFSVFHVDDDVVLWVDTAADRSVTTIMLRGEDWLPRAG